MIVRASDLLKAARERLGNSFFAVKPELTELVAGFLPKGAPRPQLSLKGDVLFARAAPAVKSELMLRERRILAAIHASFPKLPIRALR